MTATLFHTVFPSCKLRMSIFEQVRLFKDTGTALPALIELLQGPDPLTKPLKTNTHNKHTRCSTMFISDIAPEQWLEIYPYNSAIPIKCEDRFLFKWINRSPLNSALHAIAHKVYIIQIVLMNPDQLGVTQQVTKTLAMGDMLSIGQGVWVVLCSTPVKTFLEFQEMIDIYQLFCHRNDFFWAY